MNKWYFQIAKTILPGLAIAFFTAIITVRLSLRRFHAEKWWEKKVEAYSRIVDTLHYVKNYCEQKYDAEFDSNIISEEKENELRKQYKLAAKELAKATDIGSFIICDKAAEILNKYRQRPQLSWDEYSLPEVIENDLKYVSECLEEFKVIAKKDLKVNNK